MVGKERVSRRKHRKAEQQLLGLSRFPAAGMCSGFLWSPGNAAPQVVAFPSWLLTYMCAAVQPVSVNHVLKYIPASKL